jgi:opacity protein-like surface antigen
MMRATRLALIVTLATLAMAPAASAFDAEQTFRQNTFVLSVEGGYGEQFNAQDRSTFTGLEFFNAGVRLGWLPFGPTGPGVVRGALELGVEPFYQRYTDPVDAFFAGLAAVGRYHFLSLGRFVPYLEASAAAGGTDLRVNEIDSDFTFLLFGGVGAAYFLTDRAALYAGYRYVHVSNGGTKSPNRGFESHAGVVGFSYFFEWNP